jgi:DNA polymerase III delta prime subunit
VAFIDDLFDGCVFELGGIFRSLHLQCSISVSTSYLSTDLGECHYFIFDEVGRLTLAAQQSLRSTMGLKRAMFIFTTNYLPKIDPAIVNRCHLIEMNQAPNAAAYFQIAHNLLYQMGLAASAIATSTLQTYAKNAKGSMRDFLNDVLMEGLKLGGKMPTTNAVV